jgi:hypothetical protein
MLSLYIFDTKKDDELSNMFPLYRFSAIVKPQEHAVRNLKEVIEAIKKEPYRYKMIIHSECLGTLRIADNMNIMENFAKFVLFFNEENIDENEYLKLFGSLVALTASESATVDD